MLYPWGSSNPWNDFSSFFKEQFNNRVQKISVDAGFTCPNRDGTKGRGACTYCNNETFNPFYCHPSKSVTTQLTEGIAFFSQKYKTQQYLAYFQAFSNTYSDVETLKRLYDEALSVPSMIGLVIATRPDCVNEAILDLLQEYAKTRYVVLEYGIESCSNETLKKINRGHSFEDSVKALKMSQHRGLHVGIHYIIGLPGDSREDNLKHASLLSELPFETLKLHQLQIIKNTTMAKQYAMSPDQFSLFGLDEYIEFVVHFAERLSPEIIIERFVSESPSDLLIAPKWGRLKNFEITERIRKKFIELQSFQGRYWE